MKPQVGTVFDPATFTLSHVVADPETRQCALVDPALDCDPASGRTSRAGHLSAAPWLKGQLGDTLAIGERITVVQDTFGKPFDAGDEFARDGRPFERPLADGEVFRLGNLVARAAHTPGHTPACMTCVIGDAAFVGDTLLMPDCGTARRDFQGGAQALYRSLQKIYSLPEDTRMFMCHDYGTDERQGYRFETTVGEQLA